MFGRVPPILRRLRLMALIPLLLVSIVMIGIVPAVGNLRMFALVLLVMAGLFVLVAWQAIRFHSRLAALKRRAAESDWLLCVHCGHSLAGLDVESGSCPECGRAFNSSEVREAWQSVRFPSW